MAEHWKSTPKYWCKHCSTYVKDTPFEKTQHESTGKHQGNLKRFLSGIQKNHAKNEREKDQAKAEVDRLSRIAGTSSSVDSSTSTPSTKTAAAAAASKKSSSITLSVADQKRQWAQLAEMGIAVPESARANVAMPGDWQTLSRKVVAEPAADVDEKLNIGVRKRKFENQEEEEEEEEAGEVVVKRGWGSTTKTYPTSTSTSESLDSLLASSFSKKKKVKEEEQDVKETTDIDNKKVVTSTAMPDGATVKDDQGDESSSSPRQKATSGEPVSVADLPIKPQPSDEDTSHLLREDQELSVPVFKKRRPKK